MTVAAGPALAAPLDRCDCDVRSLGDIVDVVAAGPHGSRELVPEHDAGHVHGRARRTHIGVEVTAADAVAGDFHEHVARSRRRFRDVLDADVVWTVPDRGLHPRSALEIMTAATAAGPRDPPTALTRPHAPWRAAAPTFP